MRWKLSKTSGVQNKGGHREKREAKQACYSAAKIFRHQDQDCSRLSSFKVGVFLSLRLQLLSSEQTNLAAMEIRATKTLYPHNASSKSCHCFLAWYWIRVWLCFPSCPILWFWRGSRKMTKLNYLQQHCQWTCRMSEGHLRQATLAQNFPRFKTEVTKSTSKYGPFWKPNKPYRASILQHSLRWSWPNFQSNLIYHHSLNERQ